MTISALYDGTVRHRRFAVRGNEFCHKVAYAYLDLDELPRLLDRYPLWSARRPAPARFRRADFMGDPDQPLAECARDVVEEQTGARPAGPVRMLANLRTLGHVFNPVCFYYCFDAGGEQVEAVVADVNNIPWGERHPYVLARDGRQGTVLAQELDKALHVSPLMAMDQTYAFRASEPGDRLSVQIESRPVHVGGPYDTQRGAHRRQRQFDATLSMRRRELSRPLLTRMLLRYPAMSLQVVAKIYAQTLRLKLKGAPYFPHPSGKRPRGFLSP
jgi:uncharacterized protein